LARLQWLDLLTCRDQEGSQADRRVARRNPLRDGSGLSLFFSVIPGRDKVANPESNHNRGWIPGPGLRARPGMTTGENCASLHELVVCAFLENLRMDVLPMAVPPSDFIGNKSKGVL